MHTRTTLLEGVDLPPLSSYPSLVGLSGLRLQWQSSQQGHLWSPSWSSSVYQQCLAYLSTPSFWKHQPLSASGPPSSPSLLLSHWLLLLLFLTSWCWSAKAWTFLWSKGRWWFSGSGVGCRILHFFFKNLTNFWLHWVFTAGHKLSPDQREPLSSCDMRVSHCGGFSCCRAKATREAWLGITPWLFLVSFHPTWVKTQSLPEAHRPSWFLSCPLLCPPTLLCISPLVLCPGQLSCWSSDAPSTSLPLWLQLALYLALACLTEISSSFKSDVPVSERPCLPTVSDDGPSPPPPCSLSSPRSISSWHGPLWVTCYLFPPPQPPECKSKRGLCLFSELF